MAKKTINIFLKIKSKKAATSIRIMRLINKFR